MLKSHSNFFFIYFIRFCTTISSQKYQLIDIQIKNFSSIKVCFERFFFASSRIVCLVICEIVENCLSTRIFDWSFLSALPDIQHQGIIMKIGNCRWLLWYRWKIEFPLGTAIVRFHKTKHCRNHYCPWKTFHDLSEDEIRLILMSQAWSLTRYSRNTHFQSHCCQIQNQTRIPKAISLE